MQSFLVNRLFQSPYYAFFKKKDRANLDDPLIFILNFSVKQIFDGYDKLFIFIISILNCVFRIVKIEDGF